MPFGVPNFSTKTVLLNFTKCIANTHCNSILQTLQFKLLASQLFVFKLLASQLLVIKLLNYNGATGNYIADGLTVENIIAKDPSADMPEPSKFVKRCQLSCST